MGPRDDIEQAGARIEQALTALGQIEDHRVRETAQDTLRLIVGLYGDALGRIVELIQPRWPEAVDALRDDDLVASLLLVHDLHPESVTERVERALEQVRPYLGSHGGDVELVDVDDGCVQLRMLGSCDGCASSSVTLELAVEDAIRQAAPEIIDIRVEQPTVTVSGPLIAPESLLRRPPGFDQPSTAPDDGPSWQRVTRSQLPTGPVVTHARIGGLHVVLARTGAGTYAYRDSCPDCTASFDDAILDAAILTCPGCDARFDVEAAGRGVAGTAGQLAPLPLLHRDGEVELAIPAGASR